MKKLRELFKNTDINTYAVITVLVEEFDHIRPNRLLAQEIDLADHLTTEAFLHEVTTVIADFKNKGSHPILRIELPLAEVLHD